MVPEQIQNKAPGPQRFMSRLGFTPGDNLMELNYCTKLKQEQREDFLVSNKLPVEMRV